jgi:transcriptional regulator with XRE-family HTH domain
MRNKLIQVRKAAKQTETSMARRLGTPRPGYADIELGRKPTVDISDDVLNKIREILNNYDDDLFENTP